MDNALSLLDQRFEVAVTHDDEANLVTSSSTEAITVEQLYRQQGREIWALLYAYCCDADRAYDALHEAFIRLHEQERPETIRDRRAWLLQVGRNWLRDVARRQRVAAQVHSRLEQRHEDVEDAVSVLLNREQRAEVRAALCELRPDDREVLVLKYSLGWRSHRIAAALNTSSSAVDMRLTRARKRLATILRQVEWFHETD